MSKKLKLAIIIISALLTIGVAYRMYSLNEAKLLWGYLPLVLYIAGWTFKMTVLDFRFSKHPKKYKLLGLATLSGVLLTLGFPNIPLTFLMFIAFIPLLMVEDTIDRDLEGIQKWEVFKYTYHTFIVWNILTTYWVTNTLFMAGVFAIVVNSFLMSIPFVLFHFTKQHLKPSLAYAGLVAYWICFEYLHLNWELSWPWLTLGNSFAEFPSWVQWYEYTGVFGGTLWIWVANVLGFYLLQKYKESKVFIRKESVQFFAWVLIPLLASLAIYFTYEEKGKQIEVAVLQPNFEPHYEKFDQVSEQEQFDKFMKLSKAIVGKETDYLVFPETSFRGVNIANIKKDRFLRAFQNMVDNHPKLKMVIGLSAYKIYKSGEEHSPAVRKSKDTYWESYNAAIQLEKGDGEVPLYLKSKLVPGAEFFPFKNLFPFMKPLVDGLGGSVSGLGMQEEREAFTKDGVGVGPMVCYESIYGEYSAGYVRHGANVIFIVTNDGWWDNTAGHIQHLKFASLRAIEYRRSIARSANTGSSAFINQRGDISQATAYEVDAAIKQKVTLNEGFTFYVRWGDLIARIACFLSILLLLNAFVKRTTNRA